MPWGSNTHTGPCSARGSRVASTRSRLFDVASTAPGAARTAGIARAVVLPVRGPQMSTALSSHEENSGCPVRDSPSGSPGEPVTPRPGRGGRGALDGPRAAARSPARGAGRPGRQPRGRVPRRHHSSTPIDTNTTIRATRPPATHVAAGVHGIVPPRTPNTTLNGLRGSSTPVPSRRCPRCAAPATTPVTRPAPRTPTHSRAVSPA